MRCRSSESSTNSRPPLGSNLASRSPPAICEEVRRSARIGRTMRRARRMPPAVATPSTKTPAIAMRPSSRQTPARMSSSGIATTNLQGGAQSTPRLSTSISQSRPSGPTKRPSMASGPRPASASLGASRVVHNVVASSAIWATSGSSRLDAWMSLPATAPTSSGSSATTSCPLSSRTIIRAFGVTLMRPSCSDKPRTVHSTPTMPRAVPSADSTRRTNPTPVAPTSPPDAQR